MGYLNYYPSDVLECNKVLGEIPQSLILSSFIHCKLRLNCPNYKTLRPINETERKDLGKRKLEAVVFIFRGAIQVL